MAYNCLLISRNLDEIVAHCMKPVTLFYLSTSLSYLTTKLSVVIDLPRVLLKHTSLQLRHILN